MINIKEKEIAYFFAQKALENAVLLGAEKNILLKNKEDSEAILQENEDFVSFINLLDFDSDPKELFSLFSTFPQGTALCFLTKEDETETETVKALSLCSYRLVEMFNLSDVTEKLFGERGEGKVNYCLAVRK